MEVSGDKNGGDDKKYGAEICGKTGGWMRHTLIWLTPAGRDFAASHVRMQQWERGGEEDWRGALILDSAVPGILCRQPELQDGIWTCGFSHWISTDGSRRRTLTDFCQKDVELALSPFELCSEKGRESLCRRYPKLQAVFSAAEKYGVELGVYGSTALEWVTNRAYRHENSDFDLYARLKMGGDVLEFGRMLTELEKTLDIRLDVELDAGGYGIKMKELTAPGKTVLGKGLHDVRLFEKSKAEQLISTSLSLNLF